MINFITDEEFKEKVLQALKPVVVDFTASWCPPCKMLSPIIDKLAIEYEGKIDVYKIDVDKNNATPMQYGIRGVPTLIFFKNGEVVEQIVGYVPENLLREKFEEIL